MSRVRFLVPLFLLALPAVVGAQSATAPAGDVAQMYLNASAEVVADKAVGCTLRLVVPGRAPATQPLKAAVKYRGASSLGYPKKSFAFALEAPASFLGMRKHRHWILNAAYIDRSLMRHKLAYDLFRSLSAPQRPRYAAGSRFVELHLNEQYHGLYLLMERVDRDLLRLEPFVPDDATHAALYKAFSHDAGFFNTTHAGFEQKHPDPGERAFWQPLDALLGLIVTTPTAQLPAALAPHLDLDNTIDFHLLVLLTSNADGITKNFYLGRPRPGGGERGRFFFVPWDYDGTFGRNYNARPLPHDIWFSNPLFERLLRDRAYRQRFAGRWQELRQKQFSVATVQHMIEANAQEISAAMKRNLARWPTRGAPYPDRVSFEEDIAQMKAYLSARLSWLDGYIQRLGR